MYSTTTVCIQHNVFSWIYCRVLWIKMIQTISSALCLRALGRPCPCCCWATFCLQVLEFQSWKPHAIQKRFRLGDDDPGSSHHDRASASRGLQETGLNCDCWQPGEHLKLPNTLPQKLKPCFKLKSRFLLRSLRKSLLNALKSSSAMSSFFLQRRWLKASSQFPNYLGCSFRLGT